MERRQNDIFMSMLANPQASFDNIVTVGLTAANTSLQDRSTYANNKYVQEQFTNSDGDFDKVAFNKAYDTAKLYYNNLANANFAESMKRQTIYHRDSIIAPEGQRMSGPMFKEITMANPYEQVFNLTKLGRVDDPTKSADELAQSHKVLANPTTAGVNLENAQWEDSPNDNFFGNFFDTLVMAQYDEDGTHIDPITGERVEHHKGDLKTNQEGEFYYEKLDGRDVYGRRVLNKMNVLTTDGSFWNKYDFFDSDDVQQKSIGGTVMKNLALVGSMFIPYVGPWVAGLSVATQMAGLGATFGKMLVGSDSPTLSAIEGWSQSLNRQTAKTDYAQQNTWCWENFIDLIGDVAGQLKEQRFIFEKIPAAVKGLNPTIESNYAAKLKELEGTYLKQASEKFSTLQKSGATGEQLVKAGQELNTVAALKAQAEMDSFLKSYQKIGEILSKGYMTGITVADTYGEAKQAGASDLDATLLTLGYSAGEYALLNTGLGEWILPELRADRYKSKAIAKALTQLDNETSNLRKEFGAALTNIPKEGKKEYVKRLFNIGKDIANAEYANGSRTLKATLAAGAGEGVEEVSEELLADFSKGCYDVVKWLQGDNTRLNAFGYDFDKGEWNGKDILDRYGMSLVGGAVGGSLTNAFTSYKSFKQLDNMTSQQAIQEMVYMSRNGGLQDFIKQVDKMQIANPNSSATDFEVKDGQVLFAPGTETNNQDLYAKQAIKQQAQIIQNILEANGAALSDKSFLDKQTLGDLRFNALHNSTTAGAYLNEFNTLSSKLVKLQSQLQAKQASAVDTNQDGTVTDKEKRQNETSAQDKQIIKNLESQIKDTKKQLSELVEGKRSYEFVADALFEMTTDLSGRFTTTTFPLYAENKYGKKFSELTENEKAVTWNEYNEWKTGEGRDKIRDISSIYRQIAQQASATIKKHGAEYAKIPEEVKNLETIVSNLYNNIIGRDESDWLEGAQTTQNAIAAQLKQNLIEQFGSDQDKAEIQTILNQISTLDLQSPNIEEQKKDLATQLVRKQSEILLNNVSAYLKPLLDTGIANSETKNQLNSVLENLKQLAHYKAAEAEENEHPFDPNSTAEIEKWVSKEVEIQNLQKDIQSLKGTAFEKNLDEFSISIGKKPINISTLITRLNASFNDVSNNLTKFNMDEQLYRDLDNAINTIELYEAAIKGARTDNAELGNYFGYNATLNEINQKMEDKRPELAEIDSRTADAFIADINVNLNKLRFLKQLYQVNQGQKLSKQDRVSTKKDLLIYKNLKSIVSVPDKDPLLAWDGFLELQNIINGMNKHEELLRANSDNVNEKDRQDFEKEKIAAEDAIYDFFQKNKDKLEDPSKLVEFINPKRFQLYTEANELLNEDLNNLDDNSMIWWLASRAAVKSSNFYNQYKQIIDPTSEHPLAPIATQELAVYNSYAAVVNGNVFTSFYKAFRKALTADWKSKSVSDRQKALKLMGREDDLTDESLSDYAINFLPVPRYSNAVLIEGIAGSGKTSSVFRQTIAMLRQFNPELLKNVAVVHGASSDSALKIQGDIGLDDKNSKTYDRTQFMKEISSEWKEYPIDPVSGDQLVPKQDYQITSENEIKSSLGIKESSSHPSLIVIDEISKFSSYDFDLIDKFAKKYGITVLTAGDFDQSGVVGQHPINIKGRDLTWKVNLTRTNFIRTPKLGVSMRTDNSLKTHNQQRLQAFMQNPNDQTVDFEYFQDESGLYGDKLIAYSIGNDQVPQDELNLGKSAIVEDVKIEVDKLIQTLQKGEKIGYIYTDNSSPIYKLLSSDEYSDFIDLKEGGSAQGLEGRYYIIEASPNSYMASSDTKKSATAQYLRDIYTGITRAQQGSLIIAPIDIGPKFNSTQLHDKINESLSNNVIANYANKRKQLLDQVVSSTSTQVPYIPRVTETITEVKPKDDVEGGLEDGTSSAPPPAPEPIPAPIVVVDDTPDIKPSHQYDELSLSDCPETFRDNLLRVQENAIKNPKTDNGLDVDDSNTDLKYGQIVRIGDPSNIDFGVIVGVKSHEDGKHEYAVTRVGLNVAASPELISSDNITALVSTQVKQNVVLSHEEMVSRFGDVANVENINISLGNQQLQLPLCQIPFLNMRGESGTNNMINYYHRNIVVVNINGVHMPFYMSTGRGGKENVQPGLWYPFFGIKDGWLNKGTQEQINSFYGSPVLQAIAEQLNATLGTGYVDDIKGPITLDPSYQGEYPQIDFINQDMNPTANNKADTIENFNNNVENVLSKIDSAINKLLPEESPAPVEKLPYEDELQPITNTDTVSEAEYKQQIDKTNQGDNLPQSVANSNGIDMLLHSFNTFELGVQVDDKGYPVPNGGPEWGAARIDSVNGLMKVDQILGRDVQSIDNYINKIGELRSILFNTKDKSELVEKLQDSLELPGINVTFALKSSPRPGEGNRAEGREFVEQKPTPFSKGISETTLFNGSSDTRSHEWHSKSLVAIISTNGNNVLELPLLALSSPFTLMQIKDDGWVYPEVYKRFNALKTQGLSIHEISEALASEFKEQYPALSNLFRLFNFTDRAISFVKDPQWTIANGFQLLGPQFVTNRGLYQGVPGLYFDQDAKPEEEWIDVADLKKNPQISMTDVLVSLTGQVESGDGTVYKVANAGHPFVLVSYDLDLSSPQRIVDYYIKQLSGEVSSPKVKMMYVLPPKASIAEYVDNLRRILNKEQGVRGIGQLFTSYKLIKTLIASDSFRSELERKNPGVLQKVQKAIAEIDALPDVVSKKNKLYEPQNWADVGLSQKPVKLAGLFDGVLMTFLYNKNTLNSLIGRENTFTLDNRALQLVEGILNQSGIDGIYYNVKIHKDDPKIGTFNIPVQNYAIDGKPFKIHGKLDSYTFQGNVGGLVSQFLDSLRPSKDGKHFSNQDTYKYLKGYSSTTETNPDIIKIKEASDYVLNKIGKSYIDIYQSNPIEEANRLVANQINETVPGHIAFIVEGKLKISNENEVLKDNVRIFDSQNNPVTDITSLVNNNGEYKFMLETEGVTYIAEYDGKELTLTPTQNSQKSGSNTITEENFQGIIEDANTSLGNSLDVYFSTADLLRKTNYAEFVEQLRTDDYIEDELQELLEEATPEQKEILDKLLEFKRQLDNQEGTNECPLSIKIIF